MIWDAPPAPGRGHAVEIAKAVAIAALSAVATGLVQWGIESLKKRTAKAPEPPTEST
jgi:hypothetical protein